MSEFFGYSQSGTGAGFETFNDGELVKIILLDCSYPTSYLKELEKKNELIKEEARNSGIYIPTKKPSFKEGGLEWKYAVIARDKNTKVINQKIFIEGDDGLEMPRISCFGQLLCPTPRTIREKNMFSYVKGGGEKIYKNGGIDLIYLLPETNLRKDASALANEQLQLEWEQVYSRWDALTEEECKTMLNNMFSRRFLLCREGNNHSYEYIPPQQGLIFQAMTRFYTKFYSLVVIDKWNAESRKFDVHSNFNVQDVNENGLSIAKELIKLREDFKLRREAEIEEAKRPEPDAF